MLSDKFFLSSFCGTFVRVALVFLLTWISSDRPADGIHILFEEVRCLEFGGFIIISNRNLRSSHWEKAPAFNAKPLNVGIYSGNFWRCLK